MVVARAGGVDELGNRFADVVSAAQEMQMEMDLRGARRDERFDRRGHVRLRQLHVRVGDLPFGSRLGDPAGEPGEALIRLRASGTVVDDEQGACHLVLPILRADDEITARSHPAGEPKVRIDPVALLDAGLTARFGLDGLPTGEDLEAAPTTGAVLTAGARDRQARVAGDFEQGFCAGFDFDDTFGGEKLHSAPHGRGV